MDSPVDHPAAPTELLDNFVWHCLAGPHGKLSAGTKGQQMLWAGALPADDPGFAAVPFDAEHVPQMLELVTLRPPGPFADRTRELGDYFGAFDGGRPLAMAGERMGFRFHQEVALRVVSRCGRFG